MSNYDDASLIMFPSGYKEDKIYSLKPTDGSGDLTFTRASTATRVNSDGLIETSPVNLVEYSEDFSNGVWVKTNTTVSTNTTTAPNGTTTADSLLETTANATHQLWERPLMVAGQTFTQSCYIKTNGRNRVQLQIFDISALYVGALFDVVSGTIIATNGTSSIESVGNGWYRCIVSGVCPTSTTGYCVINLTTDSYTEASAQDSYTGDASKGVFIWGAQLNIGATAKPYFPTTDRLDVPRIDYTGGGCGKLLLESQRSNLQLYSEDFRNVAEGGATNTWTPNDTIILSTNNTAPDGTLSATRIRGNGSNRARQAVIFGTLGAPYSGSIFIRRVSGTASIELRVGDVSQFSTINPTSDWQRFIHTASPTSTAIRLAVVFSNDTDEFEIWGAQLEAGSYATSYIPTLASSVTRLADAVSKTGISSLIGQTEGTIFLDINILQIIDTEALGTINSGGYANNITIAKIANIIQFVRNSATQSGSSVVTSGAITNGRHKMAIAYKSGDTAFYLDGSQVSTTQTETFTNGTLSAMRLGSDSVGVIPANQSYNQAILFPTRLTNAELATLTTL